MHGRQEDALAGTKMHGRHKDAQADVHMCHNVLSANPMIYLPCRGLDCSPLSEGDRDGGSLAVCADLHGQCSCKPQCCP